MKLNSSLEVSLQLSYISQEGFIVSSAHHSHCSLYTKCPLAQSGASLPSEPAVPLLRITCAQHSVQQTSDEVKTAKSFLCRAKFGLGQDSLFLNDKDLENSYI